MWILGIDRKKQMQAIQLINVHKPKTQSPTIYPV